MKDIDLNGISYIRPVREGTPEWYFAMDYTGGDLFEMQEIYGNGVTVQGRMYLIHYPDGAKYEPLPAAENVGIGEPVYCDGRISFLSVNFAEKTITIHCFDCDAKSTRTQEVLPLSSVEDCYNLRLFEHPLILTRQPNDGKLELIWPEKKEIPMEERESFFYREGNKLYFSRWYEDPDYRTEVVVRDIETGEILETLPGDISVMPDGQVWHLY